MTDHLRVSLPRSEVRRLTPELKADRRRHLGALSARNKKIMKEVVRVNASRTTINQGDYRSPVEFIRPTVSINCGGHSIHPRCQIEKRGRRL